MKRNPEQGQLISGVTHLTVGPGAKTTACGLQDRKHNRPAVPYAIARHKPLLDGPVVGEPFIEWCPFCLAYFDEHGWPT